MFDQCVYYMSLLQDLVEEACLISGQHGVHR